MSTLLNIFALFAAVGLIAMCLCRINYLSLSHSRLRWVLAYPGGAMLGIVVGMCESVLFMIGSPWLEGWPLLLRIAGWALVAYGLWRIWLSRSAWTHDGMTAAPPESDRAGLRRADGSKM